MPQIWTQDPTESTSFAEDSTGVSAQTAPKATRQQGEAPYGTRSPSRAKVSDGKIERAVNLAR